MANSLLPFLLVDCCVLIAENQAKGGADLQALLNGSDNWVVA